MSAAPSLSETPALSSATRRALAQYAVLRRPDAGEGLANGLAVDAAGEAPTLEAAAFKQLRALLDQIDPRWAEKTGLVKAVRADGRTDGRTLLHPT